MDYWQVAATHSNVGADTFPSSIGAKTGTGEWEIYIYATYTEASAGVVKTVNGLAIASIKTINGLAVASVKTVNGTAYQ